MPSPILRRRLRLIDIRTHNTIQIPPSDYKPHRDSPLVYTFCVVTHPDDGVGDAGVDS